MQNILKNFEKLFLIFKYDIFSFIFSIFKARKIKTRVFRGNKELPWIEDDNHYDFNLQTFRLMKPFYTILPGDQITVECVYDTRDRNQTTFV
jgi:hypothetical protein